MNGPTAPAGWRCAVVAAACASLQLAGCGFHLAGERTLPPELRNVYVEFVDPYHVAEPPLETALQNRLRLAGADVKGHPDPATAVLRLSRLTEVPEVLSLGADGKAIEYRLLTQVDYEFIVGGEVRVGPDQQRVFSDYSFNIQEILPKEEETQELRGYSQDQLAELILLRVEAGLRHPEAHDSAVSAGSAAPPAPASGGAVPKAAQGASPGQGSPVPALPGAAGSAGSPAPAVSGGSR